MDKQMLHLKMYWEDIMMQIADAYNSATDTDYLNLFFKNRGCSEWECVESTMRMVAIEDGLMTSSDDADKVLFKALNGDIITMTGGASKAVLISSNCDYVLKIPYKYGSSYEDYDDEDDYETRMLGDELYNDYCSVEVSTYEQACSEGFEDFFAEALDLGYMEYHSDFDTYYVPIYAMEKCEQGNLNFYRSEIEEVDENFSTEDIDFDPDCSSWCSDHNVSKIVLECYGSRLIEIDSFLERQGVNDIHDGNIGIKNHKIKLIDYSGFWG